VTQTWSVVRVEFRRALALRSEIGRGKWSGGPLLVRRASASLALCLLASATTACAPCGWVLWEISSPTAKHPDPTYNKVAAEATNEACKQRAEVAIQRRTLQARPYGWTVTRGDANRVNFNKVGDPNSFFVDFQCWPDTVDPRGAKEK
jgi:hypothetical protein